MTKSSGPRTKPWGHRRKMCIRKQVGFTFDTEAARWQIWLEPAENRAMDTKPGWETGDQVKRRVKTRLGLHHMIYWLLTAYFFYYFMCALYCQCCVNVHLHVYWDNCQCWSLLSCLTVYCMCTHFTLFTQANKWSNDWLNWNELNWTDCSLWEPPVCTWIWNTHVQK